MNRRNEPPAASAPVNGSAADMRYLSLGGSTLQIDCQGEAASGLMDFMCRCLSDGVSAPNESDPDFSFRLVSDSPSGKLFLYAGDELEVSYDGPADMAMYLANQIFYRLAYYSGQGVMLHAACVSRRGKGILLPGDSGCGKSTLSAWLLKNGFDFLTDELTFVKLETRLAQGLCLPFNFKSSTSSFWESAFGLDSGSPEMLSNSFMGLVPPQMLGGGSVIAQAGLRAIVFPRLSLDKKAEHPLSLEPVTPGRAGLELMKQLVNGRNLPGDGFSEITRLARTLPAYELIYSSFNGIAQALDAVI